MHTFKKNETCIMFNPDLSGKVLIKSPDLDKDLIAQAIDGHALASFILHLVSLAPGGNLEVFLMEMKKAARG